MTDAGTPVINLNVIRVLRWFVAQKPQRLSGYAISKDLKIDYQTIWEMLKRMEKAGWLTAQLEQNNLTGRSKRILYGITDAGEKRYRHELQMLQPVERT